MFYCIWESICCIRSMSIFECCALAYCCTKTRTWCNTKCNEISTKIGEAKASLIICCESIPDLCSSNNQVDNVQLAGDNHVDSAADNV